ncbi:MAG TPA: prepilin-type N-terminal cleavage/methylation domain-containing protein [Pirellulales bacterium]|nr:prepilin-type N-terminal cleavage/methylation domain-containing protein [Pirellulales bacterium]
MSVLACQSVLHRDKPGGGVNRKSKIQNPKSRSAFTLVEVLIAATLSLILIGAVVQVFATVGNAAAETRAVVQITDRLRSARIVLGEDLSNTTAEMLPPQRSDRSAGYFEYIEGPDGPIFPGLTGVPVAYDINQTNSTGTPVPDSTVGDCDDVLMFTAQAAAGTYFYGRIRAPSQVVDTSGRIWVMPVDTMAQSSTAEICYFMRGNTLYRRVLLVKPDVGNIDPTVFLWSQYPQYISAATTSLPQPVWDIAFYDKFDLSVRQKGGSFDISNSTGGTQPPVLVPNTLADLTLRQNRYGHQPWVYPFDARFWDARFWTNPATNVPGGFLGLPTMRECSAYTGTPPGGSPPALTTGANGVGRWPFPLFEFNANNAIPLPPLATPSIPVAGNANVASGYLWGQPVYYTGANPPWAQPPVFPYYNPFAVAPAPPGLPLIYPYPTTPPAGSTAVNYQPVTTVPPGTWTGRIYLTNTVNGGLLDLWSNPAPLDQQDYTAAPRTGALYAFSSAYQPAGDVNVNFSTRYADDVLLTHVLSFDVKAWDPTAPTIQTAAAVGGVPPGTYLPGDPGYVQIINAWASAGLSTLQTSLQPTTSGGFVVAQGAYVDLNYLGPVIQPYLASNMIMAQALSSVSSFAGPGVAQFGSAWSTGSGLSMVYDTGCFDYENDGIDQNQNGIIDDFTNGLDDNGIGGVDDLTEVEGPTPYPVPLKGIQIRIRVFDPDSRQIREVTVTEDFLYE